MITNIIEWSNKYLLPSWVKQRLLQNWDGNGIKKYAHNTSWMFASRAATFVTSFFTIALVARYLGPENLGKLSYAQSFVSILSVFATLGINQIMVRDLTKYPEREYELLGTAILSQLVFGVVAFCLSITTSFLIGNDLLMTLLIGIISLTFIISPLGTVNNLFQARVEAKYTSQITIFLAFFIPILKLLLIFFDKGIIYFACLLLVEATISTTWSLYVYITRLNDSPLNWRFTFDTFYELMRDAWPFLFAGLFSYLYARIDQVMIQHFLGSTEVGLYDVAVKVTNVWGFIPALIITSVFPALVNARQRDRYVYLERFKSLTRLTIGISVIIAIIVFLSAKWILLIVFGAAYQAALPALQIYIWSGVISVFGILAQQYLITENKGRMNLVLTIVGAIVNICLNIYAIPHYGIVGAAAATMFSYSVLPIGLLFLKVFRKDFNLLSNRQ